MFSRRDVLRGMLGLGATAVCSGLPALAGLVEVPRVATAEDLRHLSARVCELPLQALSPDAAEIYWRHLAWLSPRLDDVVQGKLSWQDPRADQLVYWLHKLWYTGGEVQAAAPPMVWSVLTWATTPTHCPEPRPAWWEPPGD